MNENYALFLAAFFALAQTACGDSSGGAGSDGGGDDDGADGDVSSDSQLPASWTACTVNSDCTLTVTECCLGSAIGVNKDHADDQLEKLACGPEEGCGPPVQPSHPWTIASCVEGTCEAIYLRADPATACETSDQCTLRSATCCPCTNNSSTYQFIAVSESIDALVCDGTEVCAGCESPDPGDTTATCATDGHCDVVDP